MANEGQDQEQAGYPGADGYQKDKAMLIQLKHPIFPRKSRLKSITHNVPLWNNGNLWDPAIGHIFYGDSDSFSELFLSLFTDHYKSSLRTFNRRSDEIFSIFDFIKHDGWSMNK